MTPLQKKTLEHVLNILTKIDSFSLHNELSKKLSDSTLKVSPHSKEQILKLFDQELFNIITSNINETKLWLISLLECEEK